MFATANQLWDFEQKSQMQLADFYEKYQAGLLDDELQHCIEWVATYDFFVRTKRKLEVALMRTAIQPELHPYLSTFPSHKHVDKSVVEAEPPDLNLDDISAFRTIGDDTMKAAFIAPLGLPINI